MVPVVHTSKGVPELFCGTRPFTRTCFVHTRTRTRLSSPRSVWHGTFTPRTPHTRHAQKMLELNPSKRISAQQALKHPYFTALARGQLRAFGDQPDASGTSYH